MNLLTGYLDFYNAYAENHMLKVEVFPQNTIRISGEVWHFARWDPFIEYIGRKTSAVAAEWSSDEYGEIYTVNLGDDEND